MMKRPVLGKGIASLLGEHTQTNYVPTNFSEGEQLSKPSPQSLLVDITRIKPNPYQPRKIFKEQEITELSESIKEVGILQPLVVVENNDGFELIAGERRFRAAQRANLKEVPVIIKRGTTDRQKLVMAIIENVQRSNLNCVEEALAYYKLIDEFKITQEEVAKRVGKDRSTVANFLRLLKLPRAALRLLQEEKLSFGHAKVLVGLSSEGEMEYWAQMCATKNLSVRDLELSLKNPKADRKKDDKLVSTTYDTAIRELEKKTGFKVRVKAKGSKGMLNLHFENSAQFNSIYDLLMGG